MGQREGGVRLPDIEDVGVFIDAMPRAVVFRSHRSNPELAPLNFQPSREHHYSHEAGIQPGQPGFHLRCVSLRKQPQFRSLNFRQWPTLPSGGQIFIASGLHARVFATCTKTLEAGSTLNFSVGLSCTCVKRSLLGCP